jgi:hypothetical protein
MPALTVVRGKASTSMPRWKSYTFEPSNLTDGKLDTSWQPRSTSGGVGEWFQLDFDGYVRLSRCSVGNGLQLVDALGDLFLLNNRLKKARLIFSDGVEQPITFDPTQRGQVRFDVPAVRTKSVRLVVDEIEPGSKFKDLAVSEIVCHGVPIVNGHIEGLFEAQRSYEGEAISDDDRAMTFYAVEESGRWSSAARKLAPGEYTYHYQLSVEPGTYRVFAYPTNSSGWAATFTQYSQCALELLRHPRQDECWRLRQYGDLDPTPVNVGPGETIKNVDLYDRCSKHCPTRPTPQ